MKKLLTTLLILSVFSGCKTVKKDWLKENYVEKTQFNVLEQQVISSTENSSETKDYITLEKFNEFKNSLSQKSSETSSEESTTKISIEAEDGVEKSAVIGNTKVVSNGASISVEVKNFKEASRSIEILQSELEQYKTETSQLITAFRKEINASAVKITELENELQSQKNVFTKTSKKKGFTFGTTVLILGILLIIIGLAVLYFYTKNKLKWFL